MPSIPSSVRTFTNTQFVRKQSMANVLMDLIFMVVFDRIYRIDRIIPLFYSC